MNLFILDHNFWTRNAGKSIKGVKDSDSSLVSNENFSEILCSSSWALGQVTWAKSHLRRHSQKMKPKIFFIADLKTCRVFQGFEQLSSTICSGTIALVRQLKTGCFRLISKAQIYCTPTANVLTPSLSGGFPVKTQFLGCLSNCLTHQVIVLESCTDLLLC